MKSPSIRWISSEDPPEAFPDLTTAFEVPDGLLAAGGDLSASRLLYAYCHGIFPWYDEGQPILWWSPDPRCILRPSEFHCSKRLRRSLTRGNFEVSFNQNFVDVITACAADRDGQQGTWITNDMIDAYTGLHDSGWAHSVEVWNNERLAGGLYGLSVGQAFFGESMFSAQSNASKAAMLALCALLREHRFSVVDCQVESPHLLTLGATAIKRSEFAELLRRACESKSRADFWPEGRLPILDYIKYPG